MKADSYYSFYKKEIFLDYKRNNHILTWQSRRHFDFIQRRGRGLHGIPLKTFFRTTGQWVSTESVSANWDTRRGELRITAAGSSEMLYLYGVSSYQSHPLLDIKMEIVFSYPFSAFVTTV
jgi:hypothetical protein